MLNTPLCHVDQLGQSVEKTRSISKKPMFFTSPRWANHDQVGWRPWGSTCGTRPMDEFDGFGVGIGSGTVELTGL